MNLSQLLHNVLKRASDALLGRVAWVGAKNSPLIGDVPTSKPWVVILGREHYDETRRVYPVRSWWSLQSVLSLEYAKTPDTFFSIGPRRDAGRDVSIFSMKPGSQSLLGGAFFCIPESLLITRGLDGGQVGRVVRDGLEYYLSGNFASQIRGGTIVDVDLYKLSVGVAEDLPHKNISGPELLSLLSTNLQRISLGDWWTLFARRRTLLANWPWRTAIQAITLGVLIYFFLASAYLEIATDLRERQSQSMSDEVTRLSKMRREIDNSLSTLKSIAELRTERVETHRLWAILSAVWSSGGTIIGFELDGREMTLRGTSPSATNVLEALTRLPQARGVRFDAPVRSESGNESFVISLSLDEEALP